MGEEGWAPCQGTLLSFLLRLICFTLLLDGGEEGGSFGGAAVSPLYLVSAPPPPGNRKSKVKLLAHDRALVCPSFPSIPTRKVQ